MFWRTRVSRLSTKQPLKKTDAADVADSVPTFGKGCDTSNVTTESVRQTEPPTEPLDRSYIT